MLVYQRVSRQKQILGILTPRVKKGVNQLSIHRSDRRSNDGRCLRKSFKASFVGVLCGFSSRTPNNNDAPTPRPRALLPSCFPLELHWNVYFHSLQAVFSSLVRMLPRYCKSHHILMIGSCFFVQYLHFFTKKCKIVKTCGFFEKTHFVCVFSHAIATSHFHGSSDSYVIYNKKLTFQTSLIFELFAPDFLGLEFFHLNYWTSNMNDKEWRHEWQRDYNMA